MNLPGADKPIGSLVRLAQRELHGDSALGDEAGFARLEARMREAARPGRERFWLALAAAALCALGSLWLVPSRSRALTYRVAGSTASESGRVLAGEHTRISFSDGSEATLALGTEASVQNLTEHGADVVLARGSMRVHIAKHARAAWTVVAGPYDVHVTGTAFTVSWSKQTQTFDLSMETGAVIVTGPLAQGGIPLRAGQHMFGGVAEGRLTVEGGEAARLAPPPAPPTASASAPTRGEAAASAEPLALGASAPASVSTHPSSDSAAWRREVAEGHFDAVLEQAERRGLERVLIAGTLDELAALADAARYAGRKSIAKRVLLAERRRFASSGAAHDAAFFLGRIAEDEGGGGSDWYERYLNESPRGAYASQAFGRQMMILYQQRGAAAASPVAAEYLARYPNGPYAAAARKLTQESPAPRAP